MCSKQQDSNSENKKKNLPYQHCLNCGTELNGMYCHECGQRATSPTPTVRAFVLEYLNNAFIWDTQFFQTLWKLIRRPGHLTTEFLSGKFTSQEHPLKLNMFLLFVTITLFALFSSPEKVTDSVNSVMGNERAHVNAEVQNIIDDEEFYTELQASPCDTVQLLAPLDLVEKHPELFTNLETIEDTQKQGLDKWTAVIPQTLIEEEIIIPDANGFYQFNVKEDIALFNAVMAKMVDLINQYFPMLVLFTAPFLAMSVNFVQRRSRLPRIHHFIFALHYTALLELLMLFIYILYLTLEPSMRLLKWIVYIGSCTYLTVAYRNVYGTRTWIGALAKALFTGVIYMIISISILIAILFVASIIVIGKGGFN